MGVMGGCFTGQMLRWKLRDGEEKTALLLESVLAVICSVDQSICYRL